MGSQPFSDNQSKTELGDFQTPEKFAQLICHKLFAMGISPECVLEPTCGEGAFLVSAIQTFPRVKVASGFEIQQRYVDTANGLLSSFRPQVEANVYIQDFFCMDWQSYIKSIQGELLVIGNLPWVTNSAIGSFGGNNLPTKSNHFFQNGFDAISGKSNFDISEAMLLELIKSFPQKTGAIALLVKSGVARKVMGQIEKLRIPIQEASLFAIDAKKIFGVSVDACLFVIRFSSCLQSSSYDYRIFSGLNDNEGIQTGNRDGIAVRDLDGFVENLEFLGQSPQPWRSGIKHDAATVMEFVRCSGGYRNGEGKIFPLESDMLYPLIKGSEIGSGKDWDNKFILVTQSTTGEDTGWIPFKYPEVGSYLHSYAKVFANRASTIYKRAPKFAIFGIGSYSFRPWKIAICSLYKSLRFRLVGPIEGKPVMFDDTVYFISFDTPTEARHVLDILQSSEARFFLESMIFWSDKRPIKTGILNRLDWSRSRRVEDGIASAISLETHFQNRKMLKFKGE